MWSVRAGPASVAPLADGRAARRMSDWPRCCHHARSGHPLRGSASPARSWSRGWVVPPTRSMTETVTTFSRPPKARASASRASAFDEERGHLVRDGCRVPRPSPSFRTGRAAGDRLGRHTEVLRGRPDERAGRVSFLAASWWCRTWARSRFGDLSRALARDATHRLRRRHREGTRGQAARRLPGRQPRSARREPPLEVDRGKQSRAGLSACRWTTHGFGPPRPERLSTPPRESFGRGGPFAAPILTRCAGGWRRSWSLSWSQTCPRARVNLRANRADSIYTTN
jgi:hypothetical protein